MNDPVMVRAGDTLVVSVGRSLTDAEAERMISEIQGALPGVKVGILEQVTGLAVFRPEPSPAGDQS